MPTKRRYEPAGQALRVNAHQDVLRAVDVAAHQRQVLVPIVGAVGVCDEHGAAWACAPRRAMVRLHKCKSKHRLLYLRLRPPALCVCFLQGYTLEHEGR